MIEFAALNAATFGAAPAPSLHRGRSFRQTVDIRRRVMSFKDVPGLSQQIYFKFTNHQRTIKMIKTNEQKAGFHLDTRAREGAAHI